MSNFRQKIVLAVLATLYLALCGCSILGYSGQRHQRNVIYVDGERGSDSNTGKSRENAVSTIGKGLELARDGDTILMADGIYSGEGNRNLDFRGKKVRLKSAGEPSNCIIDSTREGRAFLFHSGETSSSVLDGFTIRNGYFFLGGPEEWGGEADAFRFGGGILILYSSPTIRNCIIEGNDYAGIHCIRGNPHIVRCTLRNNEGQYGGGIHMCRSWPVIEDCTIVSNFADDGGGIGCTHDSKPLIRNCLIAHNDVSYGGAGICCHDSAPAISDCIITGNRAKWSDGTSGGGIECWYSKPTITGCLITNNIAIGYGKGGGISCVKNSDAMIDRCTLRGNSANMGDAIICERNSSANVTNSLIVGNGSRYSQGAIVADEKSSLTLTNCVVAQNGGAVQCWQGSRATVVNCTVAMNTTDQVGGGLMLYESSMLVCNTIIWGNEAKKGGNQISIGGDKSQLVLKHCCFSNGKDDVTGKEPLVTEKCLNANPLMRMYPSITTRYVLRKGSPCIDAGGDSLLPPGLKKDLGNNPRVIDGDKDGKANVDIGAHEYVPAK